MLKGPKKLKFKKIKKGRLKKQNNKYSNSKLSFGNIGLKAVNSGTLNIDQLEAARKSITRKAKRKVKLWIKTFPSLPLTSKATGVRMGKGKGPFSHWGVRVRSGTVIFEISGKNLNTMFLALKSGGKKLPIKTKIFN